MNTDVRISESIVNTLPDLTTFRAGKLGELLSTWHRITRGENILSYVSGVKIPFEEGIAPCQAHYRLSVLPQRESHIVAQEIKPLLEKEYSNKLRMNLENLFLQFFLGQNLMALSV